MTRRERSYLLPKLSKEDRALLAELPRQATLADEIDFVRLHIARLADEPEADENGLARLLALLTRMVAVQAKLGAGGGDAASELDDILRRQQAKESGSLAEAG